MRNKVVDLSAFRDQKARQRPAQEPMDVRVEDAVDSFYADTWDNFEPEAAGSFPIEQARVYRFNNPRGVNMAVARLMSEANGPAPTVGVHSGVELKIRRERDPESQQDSWVVQFLSIYPMLGVMNMPQNVFESGLRLMREGKAYELVCSDTGWWSEHPEAEVELDAVGLFDPDYGPGGREKDEEEFAVLRQPITKDASVMESMRSWNRYMDQVEQSENDSE